jgi:hypothetical protein
MFGPSPPPWFCLRPSRARMCPDSILNYLHALSDLRAGRSMLQHRPGDATVSANEELAIGAIKHAAIDDGKNIEDHPASTSRRVTAAACTGRWSC